MKISFLTPAWEHPTTLDTTFDEVIFANIIDELAKIGHEITLYSNPDSMTPENGRLVKMTSLNVDGQLNNGLEHNNVATRFGEMVQSEIIHDGSLFHYAHYFSSMTNTVNKSLAQLIYNDWHNLYQPNHIALLSKKHMQLCETAGSSYFIEPYPHPIYYSMNSMINVTNPIYIYPDIDLDMHSPDYNKENYFVWTGKFMPEKNPLLAINTAIKAGVKLKMMGDKWPRDNPTYYDKNVMHLMGRSGIEYAGKGDNVTKFNEVVSKAKALIVTSNYQESFSYDILRALALGTPVIVNSFGGNSEAIVNGESGFVVSNTEEGYLDAIQRIGELKPENARRRAEFFKKGKAARQYEQMYKRMLNDDWQILPLPFVVR